MSRRLFANVAGKLIIAALAILVVFVAASPCPTPQGTDTARPGYARRASKTTNRRAGKMAMARRRDFAEKIS